MYGGERPIDYPAKRPIDYPAQGNPYNTLSPSLNGGDLWGRQTCTLTYPLRFSTWGTRRGGVSRDARARVSIKETFGVRFEPMTWTTSNVKVLPTLAMGVKHQNEHEQNTVHMATFPPSPAVGGFGGEEGSLRFSHSIFSLTIQLNRFYFFKCST